jgi:hypothetical protein
LFSWLTSPLPGEEYDLVHLVERDWSSVDLLLRNFDDERIVALFDLRGKKSVKRIRNLNHDCSLSGEIPLIEFSSVVCPYSLLVSLASELLSHCLSVEGGVGAEGGSSVLGFGVVEAICLIVIAVVGPQVEVVADLHLLGEKFEHILL